MHVDENTRDCLGVIGGPTHWWTGAGQILGARTLVTSAALTPMKGSHS